MLKKIAKFSAYLVATLIVLLAIGVGLLRIALPQLPEYRDEIQARVAAAIDGDVSFSSLDARWRLRGPEIVFRDFVVGPRIAGQQIEPTSVRTLTVGVSVTDLVFSQRLVVRRLGVDGVSLAVERDDEGWQLQSFLLPLGKTSGVEDNDSALANLAPLDISITDLVLRYRDVPSGRSAVSLALDDAAVSIAAERVRFDADVRQLGQDGLRAKVLAAGDVTGLTNEQLINGDWRASAEIDRVSAALMRGVLPPDWRLPKAGVAEFEADWHWSSATLQSVAVQLQASDWVPADGDQQSSVSGRAEWSRQDEGWLCAIDDFVVNVSDRRWPPATVRLQAVPRTDGTRFSFEASNVTVYDVPYLAAFLPDDLAQKVIETEVAGTFTTASGFVDRLFDEPAPMSERLADFELTSDFEGLGMAPLDAVPGFANLSGALRARPDTGSVTLRSRAGALRIPAIASQPVVLDALDGVLIWRVNDTGINVVSDSVRLSSGPLQKDTTLELTIPSDDSGLVVDIDTRWSMTKIDDLSGLMPTAVLSPKLQGWLSNALQGGRVENGRFRLVGNLREFPFVDGEGEFTASASARDVTMQYARQWPSITDLDAEVRLDGFRLYTDTNSGVSGGIPFKDSAVEFRDLRTAALSIFSTGNASLESMYRYADDSPIRRLFGNVFDILEVSGRADYTIQLDVPLKAIREFSLDAAFETTDAGVGFKGLPFGAEAIDGRVTLDRKGVYAEGVTARSFDRPVRMDLAPAAPDSGFGLQLDIDGVIPATALVDDLKVPLPGRIDGEAPYSAVLRLPKTGNAPGPRQPLTLDVRTSLEGLALDMPYPAGKSAADTRSTQVKVVVIDQGLELDVAMDSGISMASLFNRTTGRPMQLERATVHLGFGYAVLPIVPGLFVDGEIDRLRLDDWLALRSDEGPGITEQLESIAVGVDVFDAFGQRLRDVRATLQASRENWLIDIDSPAVAGNLILPRSLSDPASIVRLDMDRLRLLESDPSASGDSDPTTIPSARIKAQEFGLGNKSFGRLDAAVTKVANGVLIEQFDTEKSSFGITASGDCVMDPGETTGSRTRRKATISCSDVKAMMASLGYQPGINADQLASEVDVSWGGGPSSEFLASLDGEARVTISNGTLDDVEPGAGRVVGLMSVAELPRRLALDFRDVFRKGFSFDLIEGEFRIVNGDAYTCNLNLQGSSADVGLIGRASLDKRNYNQTAVVSVKVGNTLPAVGAVVAGPQVGAALLLFSQIFKKPLQGMTEVFYQINGGWDEPSIERTDSARFAATAELAGCLVSGGN